MDDWMLLDLKWKNNFQRFDEHLAWRWKDMFFWGYDIPWNCCWEWPSSRIDGLRVVWIRIWINKWLWPSCSISEFVDCWFGLVVWWNMLFRFHSEEEGKNGQIQTHTQRKKYSGCCFFVLPELTFNGHVSKKHRGMAKTRTAARFQPSDPQTRDLSILVSATSQISPQTMEKKQFKPCQGAERILQEPRHTQDLRETGCPTWDLLVHGGEFATCRFLILPSQRKGWRGATQKYGIHQSPQNHETWQENHQVGHHAWFGTNNASIFKKIYIYIYCLYYVLFVYRYIHVCIFVIYIYI